MSQNQNAQSFAPFAPGKPFTRPWLARANANPLAPTANNQARNIYTQLPSQSSADDGAQSTRRPPVPRFDTHIPSLNFSNAMPIVPPPSQPPFAAWPTTASQPSASLGIAIPWSEPEPDVNPSVLTPRDEPSFKGNKARDAIVPASQPAQTAAKLLNEISVKAGMHHSSGLDDAALKNLQQKVEELSNKQDNLHKLLASLLANHDATTAVHQTTHTNLLTLVQLLDSRTSTIEEKMELLLVMIPKAVEQRQGNRSDAAMQTSPRVATSSPAAHFQPLAGGILGAKKRTRSPSKSGQLAASQRKATTEYGGNGADEVFGNASHDQAPKRAKRSIIMKTIEDDADDIDTSHSESRPVSRNKKKTKTTAAAAKKKSTTRHKTSYNTRLHPALTAVKKPSIAPTAALEHKKAPLEDSRYNDEGDHLDITNDEDDNNIIPPLFTALLTTATVPTACKRPTTFEDDDENEDENNQQQEDSKNQGASSDEYDGSIERQVQRRLRRYHRKQQAAAAASQSIQNNSNR